MHPCISLHDKALHRMWLHCTTRCSTRYNYIDMQAIRNCLRFDVFPWAYLQLMQLVAPRTGILLWPKSGYGAIQGLGLHWTNPGERAACTMNGNALQGSPTKFTAMCWRKGLDSPWDFVCPPEVARAEWDHRSGGQLIHIDSMQVWIVL